MRVHGGGMVAGMGAGMGGGADSLRLRLPHGLESLSMGMQGFAGVPSLGGHGHVITMHGSMGAHGVSPPPPFPSPCDSAQLPSTRSSVSPVAAGLEYGC